jgi:hypothetical protein
VLRLGLPLLLSVFLLLAHGVDVAGQDTTTELFAGDSVRVDGVLIGRVLSVEGTTARVMSREKPRCRAGQAHGEAPVCDPAPMIRRDVDLRYSTVERRMVKGNLNQRTAVGGLVGAAVFGAAGYLIGPSIGFGKVEGCSEINLSDGCTSEDFIPADELDAKQKKADQWKGALFFGVIGGTASAVITRKLSTGWVRFEPTLPAGTGEPWGLTVVLPGVR